MDGVMGCFLCPMGILVFGIAHLLADFPLMSLIPFGKIDKKGIYDEGLPGIRRIRVSRTRVCCAITKKLNGDKHLVYTLHGNQIIATIR